MRMLTKALYWACYWMLSPVRYVWRLVVATLQLALLLVIVSLATLWAWLDITPVEVFSWVCNVAAKPARSIYHA